MEGMFVRALTSLHVEWASADVRLNLVNLSAKIKFFKKEMMLRLASCH